MTEISDRKTFWKRSTMEIITFTEGTLMDIIQLARKDILSLITTIESLQNMNCAECSNKDEELEKWKNEGLRLMAVNQHLEIDFQSQKEEIESHGPEGRNYTNLQYVDLLQKFESLKAITELAVKGLKQMSRILGMRELDDLDIGELRATSDDTLSEIEKLQND